MRHTALAVAIVPLMALALAAPVHAQGAGTPTLELARLQKGVKTRRISSFDKAGGNNDRLEKIAQGERRTLADIKGAGRIDHIWVTIAPPPPAVCRHDIILRMYWDDETTPSVEAPIGEFFGQGWNESYPMAALPLAAGPREGRAMVSYFPMPFRAGRASRSRTTRPRRSTPSTTTSTTSSCRPCPRTSPYFHAWYNHELTEAQSYGENEWTLLGPEQKNTTGAGNFLIADIAGRGHYVGMNYYVHSPSPMWYGEGDDLFQVDGEPWPSSLHGTGTEDYFNTSWSPNKLYQHPFFGYARVNGETGWLGRTHVYRFHPTDPVCFENRCASRSSTATTTTSRSTSRPWPTGTRPSRTRRSRPSPIARVAQADAEHRRARSTAGATPGARRTAAAASSGGTRKRRSNGYRAGRAFSIVARETPRSLRASASRSLASPWTWNVRCTCVRLAPGASAAAGEEVSSS